MAEPSISCNVTSEVQARLLCSAEPKGPPDLMKFNWWLFEGPQPGPELAISLRGEHDGAVYSCGVSNPVSAKNTTFTAKDCYPGKISLMHLLYCIDLPFFISQIVLDLSLSPAPTAQSDKHRAR